MKRNRSHLLLFVGLILLLLSAWPLFLHVREMVLGTTANARYDLLPVYDGTRVEFYGNEIVLSDAFTEPEETWREGSVAVVINGTDYSHPATVVVRPAYRDANRYHGYLKLVELYDNRTQDSVMAVIQRISGTKPAAQMQDALAWRLLLVGRDGTVTEETFRYGEQATPLYRKMLANFASPMGIGFYSDVMYAYPTLVVPLFYPFVTGIAGLLLLLAALLIRLFARRPRNAP